MVVMPLHLTDVMDVRRF